MHRGSLDAYKLVCVGQHAFSDTSIIKIKEIYFRMLKRQYKYKRKWVKKPVEESNKINEFMKLFSTTAN